MVVQPEVGQEIPNLGQHRLPLMLLWFHMAPCMGERSRGKKIGTCFGERLRITGGQKAMRRRWTRAKEVPRRERLHNIVRNRFGRIDERQSVPHRASQGRQQVGVVRTTQNNRIAARRFDRRQVFGARFQCIRTVGVAGLYEWNETGAWHFDDMRGLIDRFDGRRVCAGLDRARRGENADGSCSTGRDRGPRARKDHSEHATVG